ncbi:Bax inhibitor-1/YccA family protein [Streptomyces spiralis]
MSGENSSLKSSNPLLARPGFKRQGGRKTAAGNPLVSVAVVQDRAGGGKDADPARMAEPASLPPFVGDLMTMDHVIARSALTLAITVLAAVLCWTVQPIPPTSLVASCCGAAAAGLIALVLVLVQWRRARPSPVRALAFAAFEGAFLAVLSGTVSTHVSPGVFVQGVLGTMAVFAGVLVAYRLRWIRVTRRRSGFVTASAAGMILLMASDVLLCPVIGADGLGFHNAALGVCAGVAGIALAAPFLALHFKQVEDGVTHGAPREDAWLAAFGLTLTLVWLYVETVRLLTLVPEDDVD